MICPINPSRLHGFYCSAGLRKTEVFTLEVGQVLEDRIHLLTKEWPEL
jgi:hypothetical protein